MDTPRGRCPVRAFCERPRRLTLEPEERLVDFWVQGADGEETLLLDLEASGNRPAHVDGIAPRAVPAAELAAVSIWVANWSRMLPVINATRGLLPEALLESVVRHVREPVPLSVLEHKLSFGDPTLARDADGRLGAEHMVAALPVLHVARLSRRGPPAPRSVPHPSPAATRSM